MQGVSKHFCLARFFFAFTAKKGNFGCVFALLYIKSNWINYILALYTIFKTYKYIHDS